MAETSLPGTHRIVWFALLFAQALYVIVGLGFGGAAGTSLTEVALFPLALGAVAVVTGGAAHFYWRRASGSGLAIHQPPGQPPAQAFTFFILAWVFDESIAIYGLVLALVGFPAATWLVFSAGAAALLLVHRPTDAQST